MELKNITLERMNNGAHYLYVSNILANAEKNAQREQGIDWLK